MTDRNKVHLKLGDDVIVTRVDSALSLNLLSNEKIRQVHAAIDAYLNTRPGAPDWLLALSDALNETEVPARYKDRA